MLLHTHKMRPARRGFRRNPVPLSQRLITVIENKVRIKKFIRVSIGGKGRYGCIYVQVNTQLKLIRFNSNKKFKKEGEELRAKRGASRAS